MTKLSDLVSAGILPAGSILVFEQKRKKKVNRAEVTSEGLLMTEDGVLHKTPSGAARHLNENKPIDGWHAWRTDSDISLDNLRKRLLK